MLSLGKIEKQGGLFQVVAKFNIFATARCQSAAYESEGLEQNGTYFRVGCLFKHAASDA
jgi:hypothetical protein